MTDNHKGMLMLIAAVVGGLMVLMLIAVFASVCHGQALQQPIVYEDGLRKLDPLAVDIDIRELARWSRYCIDNIDTLGNRVDTTQADVDTLLAEVDTLHARVDSNDTEIAALETERDSIYWGYDSVGTSSIPYNQGRNLVMDREVRDDYGIHADADSFVIITSAGDYALWYDVTLNTTPGDTLPYPVYDVSIVRRNEDADYLAGSYKSGMTLIDGGSTSAYVIASLSADDTVYVNLYNTDDVNNQRTIYTTMNACSFGLQKLH